jgi:hypothetical protein
MGGDPGRMGAAVLLFLTLETNRTLCWQGTIQRSVLVTG